jgi:hypothetical protein
VRELLLSIASPTTLSEAGFVILALGLLGEVGVLVIPEERHAWHKLLGFVFAAIVLVGYLIGHAGDDEIAARAELELQRIKTPRMINDEKYAKLVACLKEGPKGPGYVRPGFLDTDGPMLAERIEKALKEAGFEPPPEWKEGMGILGWRTAGVFLIVTDMKKQLPHAASIQRCFWQIDWQIYGHEDPKHPEEAVSIGIGPRL